MKKRIVTYFIVGGAAVLGASPHLHDFLRKWEGVEYVAYADKIAGGVPTVCAGITNAANPSRKVVVGERWTGEECKDRKSTRLNSSHVAISYAVFCLKKK